MRFSIVLLMILLLVPAGVAIAEQASPLDVQPISPQEIVEKIDQIGQNVVELSQGVAPSAMWIAFVVAAGLIFIGLPIMMFTKKVFTSGLMVLVGIFLMYVLVFHPGAIIGVVKGVLGVD